MKRTNLHIVEPAEAPQAAPAEAPKDITLAMRVEIEKRDWNRVMIDGDRAPAINLPQRRKWSWSRPSPLKGGGI